MPGWESLIRISKCPAWTNQGTLGQRGHFLFADSANLDLGAQVSEIDTKLGGYRESMPDTFRTDRYYPRGEFTFQPRVDDILMILMAHFQNVVKSGTGTYTFYRVDRNLTWTVNGSNIGTHPYTVNVDLLYSPYIGTANGMRFTNGFVDSLTLGVRYGEDLICTPSFKFYAGSTYTYPAGFGYPSVYGSQSEYSRFTDFHATVVVAGKSYSIENWQGNFNNNSGDRSKLGYAGYNRFPLAGKWIADGSFDHELEDSIDALKEGEFGSLHAEQYQATTNRILVVQPNVGWRAFTIPISGGDAIIDFSHPYRAYPPSGTTGPSTQVSVITGTNFGTDLLGF
jgi:hypothetical protein